MENQEKWCMFARKTYFDSQLKKQFTKSHLKGYHLKEITRNYCKSIASTIGSGATLSATVAKIEN
ncbi:MAG: hypothetical protein M3Q95_01755 [Bacteroidota bacterium]|nr:hypothetical protein [Bacteroidota bacterium]